MNFDIAAFYLVFIIFQILIYQFWVRKFQTTIKSLYLILSTTLFLHLLGVSDAKIVFYLAFGLLIYFAQKFVQKNKSFSVFLSISGILSGWALFKLTPIEMIGFSYAGFKSISLIVEVKRGRLKDISLVKCLAYILFFPTFVQGPINRPGAFFEDLANPRPVTMEKLKAILFRFGFGVIKVMLVSPIIFQFTFLYLVQEKITVSYSELFIALCMTYFFIYIQFSGISDIAITVSRCLGFKVIENFNFPIIAQNLNDFWSRWHISLTSFCRDYIYFTTLKFLTKKWSQQHQRIADSMAIMLTFLTIGLWHGLEQNWLIYGLLHGVGVILVNHIFGRVWKRINFQSSFLNGVLKSVNSAMTFVYISSSLFFIVPLNISLGIIQ